MRMKDVIKHAEDIKTATELEQKQAEYAVEDYILDQSISVRDLVAVVRKDYDLRCRSSGQVSEQQILNLAKTVILNKENNNETD